MTWDEVRQRAEKLALRIGEMESCHIHFSPEGEKRVQAAFDRLDAAVARMNSATRRSEGG